MADDVRYGELAVVQTDDDGHCTLTLRGELDVNTSAELREHIIGVLDAGTQHLVVDLAALEFIDSTGLGVLVGAQKRLAQRGGTMTLRSPRPAAMKVFATTGLDQVFDVEVPGSD